MVAFASKLEMESFKQCIVADTLFTHCNQVALDCTLAYSYTIKLLINSTASTFKLRAEDAITQLSVFISQNLASEEIADWYNTALCLAKGTPPADYTLDSVRRKQGWCKHGFVLSIYFLQKYATRIGDESSEELAVLYEAILAECLSLGGDTDTNGAIVGGVIGALLGEQNIP